MADTPRTRAELLALFADNTTGLIIEQSARDLIVSGPIGTDQAPLTAAAVVDLLHPVGSLYVSTLSTNPATLFGRGTWAAYGAGRVMVGLDAADTDFDTVNKTAGAKTVAGAGSNSIPAFTGSALGTHSHTAGTLAPSAHLGAGVDAHGVTQPSAHSNHVFTQSSAHVVTQPSAHSNHVVTQPGAHSNHVVTQPNAHAALAAHAHELPYQIPSTTTIRQIAVATFGTGTSRAATAVSAAGTGNTTSAAVALSESKSAGTPDAHAGTGVDAHSAHSGAGVDAHSAHAGTAVDAHSGAGVDAHSAHAGTAVANHVFTQPSAHTMSGATSADSAGTPAGTVTAPTFTGSATSVVQPSIVVYMWRRTA